MPEFAETSEIFLIQLKRINSALDTIVIWALVDTAATLFFNVLQDLVKTHDLIKSIALRYAIRNK